LGDELPRRSTENDFVIIYFSGHGTPEIRGGQELPSKYLVPVDGNTSRVYSTCYNLETDLIGENKRASNFSNFLFNKIIRTC
jgi:hypothetical protein